LRGVDLNAATLSPTISWGDSRMNAGKTLFAQLMDFLPWSTFMRIVARYGGDRAVRTLPCAEQFRVMAFAQLTYRESLRDIEACLSAQAAKLYHMGFREPVRRSTLADANEARDWRIYAEFAHRLIAQARRLYAGESLGVDLTNTVYALDSTTIDLCLSMFPWAHFRSTKAAVKLHTLLDLRGNIPSFTHISDGKLHDVHALDMLLPEPGAIYVMDRGYVDFARLHVLHQAGAFFVTRAKSNLDAHRIYSAPTDRTTGVICDQTIALDGYLTGRDYPEHLRRIRFRDAETGKTLVFLTNQLTLPASTICALYKSRWQVELFFKWIKQHLRIKQFYGTSENAVKTQIWIAVSVYVLVAIVRKRLRLEASLYTLLQVFSVTVFEKLSIRSALLPEVAQSDAATDANELNLFAI
jgi:transposase